MDDCRSSSLERALPVLRRDLRAALGGASDKFEGGARVIILSDARYAQVIQLLDAIRGAERVIGRVETGPEWLDELIDGYRRVMR